MTTSELSSKQGPQAVEQAFGPSLADVMAWIEGDRSLDPIPRRQILSAIRTACRVFRANPKQVPAEPRHLRLRLNAVTPASTGLGRGTWRNVRSLTLTAIRRAGVRAMAGSTRAPLAFSWEALRARIPDKHRRCALSRFMSFCSTQAIAPDGVDEGVFGRYRDALENESLVKEPKQVFRTTCVTWNESADNIPGWPQFRVSVPDGTRRYAYAWDHFPPSFGVDAEDHLEHLAIEDPFSPDYVKSLSSATIEGRRQQILQIASALVLSGFPAEQVTGLAALVRPENAELALHFFWDRAGQQKTEGLYQQAILLRSIARHWVKLSGPELKAIEDLSGRFATKKNGMTEKNRALLRQFDDEVNVDALLALSSRVLREVQAKDRGGRRDAGRVALALAVESLIVAPMRIKNLTLLEHERHLLPTRYGAAPVMHLVLAGEEVKNKEPYEMPLPKRTAEFLALFLKEYHHRLTPVPSPWLFPGYGGGQRHVEAFSRQISEFVLRETGIRKHVHLFRHLAVKLYLEAHPGDLETARRLLGHTSLRTTMRSYADIKTAASFRRYDEMLDARREGAEKRLLLRGRSGGGA